MKAIESFKAPLSKIPKKMDKYIKWFQNKSTADIQISGTYNFFVDISIQGESPYQTSTISINCFTKPDRAIPIPSKCQWFRRYDSREYHFTSISNCNTYQLSAEDLNSTIRIEINSLEDGYNGTAVVEYGPIRLDPNTRHALEGILSAGGSKFPAKVLDLEDQTSSLDSLGSVSLTDDCMRIVQDLKGGKTREVQFRYNYDQPKIVASAKSPNEVSLLFDGTEPYFDAITQFTGKSDRREGQKIVLSLCSRASRDLFMLALKCFSTRNYLIDSRAISEVLSASGNQKNFRAGEGSEKGLGDMFLEVEAIKREMNCIMNKNAELLNDKRELQEGIKILEEELKSTIEIYSRSLSSASPSRDQNQIDYHTLLEKVEKLQKENDALIKENKKLQNEVVINKLMESNVFADKENIPAYANKQKNTNYEMCIKHELEIDELKTQIEKLSAEKASLERELKKVIPPKGSAIVPASRDDKLSVLEQRVKESKHLNEMLLKQIEQQKFSFRQLEIENSQLKSNPSEIRNPTDQETKAIKTENPRTSLEPASRKKIILRRDSVKHQPDSNPDRQFEGLSQQLPQLEKENLYFKSRVNQAEEAIQLLKRKNQHLEALIIEKENESREYHLLKEKISELQIENEHATKTINALKSSRVSLDQKSAETLRLEAENQKLRHELEIVKKRYEEAIEARMFANTPRQSVPSSQDSELKKELERIKNENECLVMQRNQISKKAEALQKELISKDKEVKKILQEKKSPEPLMENLKKTNERLIIENSELFTQVQNLHNELKIMKERS